MSNFLKVTGVIINTNYIQYVFHDKTLQKYSLYLIPKVSGAFIFGSGSINTNNEICATKKDHSDSYETIDRWVNSLECASNANKKNND